MDISAKKAKSLKNAEKRRERSKVAARSRRGKESEIFSDLSTSLPMPEAAKSALDKASIMRLTLCNLKIKRMMEQIQPSSASTRLERDENDAFLSTAMSGAFLLVFTLEGDVIYASEGISGQLGFSATEIMGGSIFDFTHQYDHNDIKAILKGDHQGDERRSALFRMKCTVASRGRNAHLRSANYKVVNCVGRLEGDYFVSLCEPLLHPSDVDIPLNKQTLLSKHSPDMKFEYVDDGMAEFLGYKPEEMVGKSMFEFQHAADCEGISKSFKSLYEKEQTQTDHYRFLTKGGGWVWIMTQATLIHPSNSGKGPASIVCIHFITSGREEEDQVLSAVQVGTPVSVAKKKATPLSSNAANISGVGKPGKGIPMETNVHAMTLEEENNFIAQLLVGGSHLLTGPKCSTTKIFAPKTEDMDSGFLSDCLTVTKEEPEDLTHLAPIAGDECVPLEDVPLLEDLLASLDDGSYTFLDPDSEEIPTFVPPPRAQLQKPMPQPLPAPHQQKAAMMPLTLDVSSQKEMLNSAQNLPTLMKKEDPFLCGCIASSPIPEFAMAVNNSNNGNFGPTMQQMQMQQQWRQSPTNMKLLEQANSLLTTTMSLSNNAMNMNGGRVEVEAPPASKMARMQEPSEPSKIYILVPVQHGRRNSASGSSISNGYMPSDPAHDGEAGIDLVDLVKGQESLEQQQQIREFLTNIGLNLGEAERSSLGSNGNERRRKRDADGNFLGRKFSLHELTRQDCEVNAPLGQTTDLLQGPDLLNALEIEGTVSGLVSNIN